MIANTGYGEVYGDLSTMKPGEVSKLVNINGMGECRCSIVKCADAVDECNKPSTRLQRSTETPCRQVRSFRLAHWEY